MTNEKRIDFQQLAKPTNLQNSAVLRMLEEEEERKRMGKLGLKRVAWPPPQDSEDNVDYVEQDPVQAKTRGVGEYATLENKSPARFEDTHQQQQLRQPSQFQAFQVQQQQQQQQPNNTWKPVSPLLTRGAESSPIVVHEKPLIKQTPATPTSSSADAWLNRPVPHFTSWNDQPQQTLVIAQDQHSQQPYPQFQNTKTAHFEPPPSIITLRQEAPISQESSPVYQAQPAAINPNSGSMRGDQKWPPASVKDQTEAENQARLELAKGPVCRPRKVNKDYSGFFAQHAVTNNYPGYRAPPGTQYFTPAYQQ